MLSVFFFLIYGVHFRYQRNMRPFSGVQAPLLIFLMINWGIWSCAKRYILCSDRLYSRCCLSSMFQILGREACTNIFPVQGWIIVTLFVARVIIILHESRCGFNLFSFFRPTALILIFLRVNVKVIKIYLRLIIKIDLILIRLNCGLILLLRHMTYQPW